ncbi:MAG: zinc-binding dehydrogenase [Candidatus Dormibacteria bacterium]
MNASENLRLRQIGFLDSINTKYPGRQELLDHHCLIVFKPQVTETLPLEQAAEALKQNQQGQTRGKIVLKI